MVRFVLSTSFTAAALVAATLLFGATDATRTCRAGHYHHHQSHRTSIKNNVDGESSYSSTSASSMTPPFGLKAGVTGESSLDELRPYIGSYSNWRSQPWSPNPPDDVQFLPMLWGAGHTSDHDSELVQDFKSRFLGSNTRTRPPKFVLGFEEPDCETGHGSSGISVSLAAKTWNELLAPLADRGTHLISPSMCKQSDEDFLTPFESKIDTPWQFTNVHANADNVDDVKRVIDYYWTTYKKPIIVSEWACVSTNPWRPVTDQGTINKFIRDVVDYFESDDRVFLYQLSQGEGLSEEWHLTKPDSKELTETGRVYRDAIKKYAGAKTSPNRRSVLAGERQGLAAEVVNRDAVFVPGKAHQTAKSTVDDDQEGDEDEDEGVDEDENEGDEDEDEEGGGKLDFSEPQYKVGPAHFYSASWHRRS